MAMVTKKEALDAKRVVEGPLAIMIRFFREDCPWINDDLRDKAKKILEDIVNPFEDGNYEYVVNRVEVAKAFFKMLESFDVWLKEILLKEYSFCPICGQPLEKEHFCSEKWQEIIASRAGNSSAFEVKSTENEVGDLIVCLSAQKVEDKFQLKMVVNYHPWEEVFTITSWNEVSEEEKQMIDKINCLRNLKKISFTQGYRPKQLRMVTNEAIFVCQRWYEKLIYTEVPYLCKPDGQIGTKNGVPVVIMTPVCSTEKLNLLEKSLCEIRKEQHTKKIESLIQVLQKSS